MMGCNFRHEQQLLGDLPAADGDPAQPEPFSLPPMGRFPETCYVRTRGDIILAVVRKKDLLKCDQVAGLRSLKTTACPARIKVSVQETRGLVC